MKKITFIFLVLLSSATFSQSKGSRIGFIDMEYILEKVPNYAEAKNQLDQKAQKWKMEIEEKKTEINKLKLNLKNEKPLLTKELIEEREDEILYLETEMLDYQQKRFGPQGDLILQKSVLIKPIQDQVFSIIQDLAEKRQYDFIFDKSSEVTMLFAKKQHDISDLVINRILNAEKRQQMTAKQLKQLEEQENKEEERLVNPNIEAREKLLEERKATRDSIVAKNKQDALDRKNAAAEKRKKQLEEKENKKNGTQIEGDDKKESEPTKTAEQKKSEAELLRQQKIDERNKLLEQKKKELEEKKQKAIETREANKKALEEKKTKKE